MKQYPFIFSDDRKYRLQRHLSFWGFWFLFMSFLYSFLPCPTQLNYVQRLPSTVLDSALYLSSHIFLSYCLMYFVIPRYIVRTKYKQAAFWTVISIMLTGMLAAYISLYIIGPVEQFVLPKSLQPRFLFYVPKTVAAFAQASMAGLRGGLTVGGLAAAIKLMKHWYMKEQANIRLQKENAESKLQVLKAQLHPHFLFNTLNNIYSNAQYKAPEAASMICGLSDMLRYMLYECNTKAVPLSKELKMVQEYISLEQIRYGNKLEVHMDLPDNTDGYYIAPLLLLPFVENCFKHGLSHILDQPWLTISITLDEKEMNMKIMNSKPPEQVQTEASGIGIANAEKRLELLYPGRYNLSIKSEPDVFIVQLRMELEKVRVIQNTLTTIQTSKAFAL